jgi:hypothetical protein
VEPVQDLEEWFVGHCSHPFFEMDRCLNPATDGEVSGY